MEEEKSCPYSHWTILVPIYRIADSKFVIAPQNNICPQGRTCPRKAVPIVKNIEFGKIFSVQYVDKLEEK